MEGRPRHIDLPKTSADALEASLFTPHGEPTPPLPGMIPPALSPLDAFAFQSRLLAKRFEETSETGRRISRLPHLTIQNEFARVRPAYLRSPIQEEAAFASPEADEATPRSVQEVMPVQRPMSTHPVILTGDQSSVRSKSADAPHSRLASVYEADQEQEEGDTHGGYFSIPARNSPEPLDELSVATAYASDSGIHAQPMALTTSNALHVRPSPNFGLAAPSPHFLSLANSPSIRSVMEDGNSEDVDSLSIGGASNESAGHPRTPASPFRAQMVRSPSFASERSMSSAGFSRPSLNYSRPLSRSTNPSFDLTRRNTESPFRQNSGASGSTRPSLEVPMRQDAAETPLTPFTNDDPHTPVSVSSSAFFSDDRPSMDGQGVHQSSSYTYTKYALPRGKNVKRESLGIEDLFNRGSALIDWSDQNDRDAVPANGPYLSSSPAYSDVSRERRRERPSDISGSRPSTETQSSPRQRRVRSRASSPSTVVTTSDASTIKARLQANAPAQEITPEQHLQMGIDFHESGALQKSTYHMRLAAKAGLSDAMLLYALACRHGWGMRPSPAEAVTWLQKAVDSAQLTVAQDEHLASQDKPLDTIEKAKHKAQFALGVYELGMSYAKGWGVKQDKALALRCFEVAGSWGDADALAEAGFCYAEGVGCRKDMKRAAKFYREAEKKGVSMAGNSWIHKDKYKDDPALPAQDGEQPQRPASRRRGRSNTSASKTSTTTASTATITKREKSRSRFFRKKSSSNAAG